MKNTFQMLIGSPTRRNLTLGSLVILLAIIGLRFIGVPTKDRPSGISNSKQPQAVAKIRDAANSQREKDRLEAWEPFDYLHDATAPVRYAMNAISQEQKRQQSEALGAERQRLQEFQGEQQAAAANFYDHGQQSQYEAERRAAAAGAAAVRKWRGRLGGQAAAVGVFPGSY